MGTWAGRRRLAHLPILLGAKQMVCVFCGHNSGEKNPLLMADASRDEESPKWRMRAAHFGHGQATRSALITRASHTIRPRGNYAGIVI